jgi:hypothetical protein
MSNTHTSESGLSEQEVWLIRFEYSRRALRT